jgi:hypothetical protein
VLFAGRGQKSGPDHVGLDHFADRREQARHVASAHPLPALRIEHRFQFLDDEGDIAAAPEHSTDHPRQRNRPGVMLEVLGVDEDFERPPAAVALDVVHRDVDGVVARLPLELVGEPRQHGIALERSRHVDDVAGA